MHIILSYRRLGTQILQPYVRISAILIASRGWEEAVRRFTHHGLSWYRGLSQYYSQKFLHGIDALRSLPGVRAMVVLRRTVRKTVRTTPKRSQSGVVPFLFFICYLIVVGLMMVCLSGLWKNHGPESSFRIASELREEKKGRAADKAQHDQWKNQFSDPSIQFEFFRARCGLPTDEEFHSLQHADLGRMRPRTAFSEIFDRVLRVIKLRLAVVTFSNEVLQSAHVLTEEEALFVMKHLNRDNMNPEEIQTITDEKIIELRQHKKRLDEARKAVSEADKLENESLEVIMKFVRLMKMKAASPKAGARFAGQPAG